jgi:hypothetical protein
MTEYLSMAEAAQALGFKDAKPLYQRARRGKLAPHSLIGRLCLTREQVDEIAAEGTRRVRGKANA